MSPVQAAMRAVDQEVTREEYMFAVAMNAHVSAIAPRRLLTGHDIRQIRIIAQMLDDAPTASVEAQRFEVVGDRGVVSSRTLNHMSAALDALNQTQEEKVE